MLEASQGLLVRAFKVASTITVQAYILSLQRYPRTGCLFKRKSYGRSWRPQIPAMLPAFNVSHSRSRVKFRGATSQRHGKLRAKECSNKIKASNAKATYCQYQAVFQRAAALPHQNSASQAVSRITLSWCKMTTRVLHTPSRRAQPFTSG